MADVVLRPGGLLYLVLISLNRPSALAAELKGSYGWESAEILRRHAGGELLHVLRFQKPGPFAVTKMSPYTPLLDHLNTPEFRDTVYPPCMDSYALMDALEADLGILQGLGSGALCVEVGCGSGVVTAFLHRFFFF